MQKLRLSAILGAITVFALVTPTWAAGDGSITFGQGTVNTAVGQSFTLDVNFNTGSNQVGVVTAEVQFDESVLTLDIPNITHVGSPLAIYPPVVVDQNDAGHVTITGAAFGDASPTSGTGYQGQGLLATLPFTLTAAPSGNTTAITLGSGSSILIDDDNGTTNTLGSTNQVTVSSAHAAPNDPNNSDTTAPVISAIQGTVASNTSLTITWTTNEATTGTVDYGVSTSLGQSVQSTTSGTTHTVTLSNLISGTKYYFKITAKDASNNTSASALQNVTTSGSAPIGGGGTTTGGSTNNTTNTTSNKNNTSNTNKTGNSILAPKTGAGTLITVVVVIGLGLAAGAVYFYLAQRSNATKNQQPPKVGQ